MKIEIGGVVRTLKGLQAFKDHKNDRMRYRIRRVGHPYKELPPNSDPTSLEFLEAYYMAWNSDHMVAAVQDTPANGTVREAIDLYLGSTAFTGFKQSTQNLRRPMYKRFVTDAGDVPIARCDHEGIDRWLKAASSENARHTAVLTLRPFFKWAIKENLIAADPMDKIESKAVVSADGIIMWEPEEIERYRTHYPVGTMERVALELVMNVGSRRGDAIILGPRHLKKVKGTKYGVLAWTAEKNDKRKPVNVSTPVMADLAKAIAACPLAGSQTFLVNKQGKPFSKGGFGSWFRRACDAAGLLNRSLHGVRKAGATRLAEEGCATTKQLQAWGGWATLVQPARYTEKADIARLSAQAIAQLEEASAS